MSVVLPPSLQPTDDKAAVGQLARYFAADGQRYTGAEFDDWDPTGTRVRDAATFTSDDLVAITFLSVVVPPRAAERLLVSGAAVYVGLLEQIDIQTPF